MPDTITLTPEQIRALADFAEQEGSHPTPSLPVLFRPLTTSLNIRG